MDKLLAAIKQFDDEEEDLFIVFNSAVWEEKSLILQINLGLVGGNRENWEIQCGEVLSYKLSGEYAAFLDLIDDHPLLWEFKQETASAFFYGVPANIQSAISVLYEVHENFFDSHIPCSRYFHKIWPLSRLLSAGDGLLARGPIELLKQYQARLSAFGTKVSICSSQKPTRDANNIKLLWIGNSYIIGKQWSAHKLP
jgi:hypothetical protein